MNAQELKREAIQHLNRVQCTDCGKVWLRVHNWPGEPIPEKCLCRPCYNVNRNRKSLQARAAFYEKLALRKAAIKKKQLRMFMMKCDRCEQLVPIWFGISYTFRCPKCNCVFPFKAVPVIGWRGLYAKEG